ncbi:hypothetical protein [Flavobacterium sp.]|uniref:hypothetical protein n=1 Tax=Flavobacterium sp. TaxID=239 RepID=UPI002CE90742|nr:hypothetical protein [Flavobacterium sp.]HSD07233.1 hypothetical protein [Flavobacterium sp.]
MENNNIDFKDLWKQQSVNQPDMNDLLSKLNTFKKLSMRKLILTNLHLVTTALFILFIWFYFKPEFISTKIGIVLIIIAMAMYLFVYNRLFAAFKKIDSTKTNSEYLQKLIEIKTKQKFLQSTILSLYFLILGTGLGLYMYEYTSQMTQFWAVFSYGLVLLWFGFSWFYFRPRYIRKEEKKVNILIEKFETINHQLEEDL